MLPLAFINVTGAQRRSAWSRRRFEPGADLRPRIDIVTWQVHTFIWSDGLDLPTLEASASIQTICQAATPPTIAAPEH